MLIKIMRGVPGSGKSTYTADNFPKAVVCSADHFFMDGDKYEFDASKLPLAHGASLRKFAELVRAAVSHPEDLEVVVDNTCISAAEIAPYMALGQAYGHDVEIPTFYVNPSTAAARNVHGVPEAAVRRMSDAMLNAQLPPWWKNTVISL